MYATESHAPTSTSSPAAIPIPITRSPSPLSIESVSVPPACYPIELVQFWRGESKPGHPNPLHWALFIRTIPYPSPPSPSSYSHSKPQRKPKPKGKSRPTPIPSLTAATGNFYELVGDPETYTAQILHGVTFMPDRVPDWRGTHVVGWVRPAALPMFERTVKRVPVLRHRAGWRSQHWVYEVLCACRAGVRDQPEGRFLDVGGVSMEGLQKYMGRLLDAWEKGDI